MLSVLRSDADLLQNKDCAARTNFFLAILQILQSRRLAATDIKRIYAKFEDVWEFLMKNDLELSNNLQFLKIYCTSNTKQ